MIYNKSVKKKPTNVSINADLLQKAKDHKINLSNALERTLESMLVELEKETWETNNKTAINQYNQNIDKYGTFSDSLRSF